MPTEGVPLHQLHCPSCGALYEDFNLHSDTSLEQFQAVQTTPPLVIEPLPWYIVCPNGHQWTIKTLWRAVNHPDRVQLDRYLGEA